MKSPRTLTSLLTAALGLVSNGTHAADLIPMTLQMTWKAQAEHGGFHQAVARGFYEACGVDMIVRDGGPGMDTAQLLSTGAVQAAAVSQADGVMAMVAAGFPAQAVMTTFQKIPQILMYHDGQGIAGPEDLAGRPILMSQSNRVTIWPFLKAKYGLSDADLRAYNGQIALWMTTPEAVQQGFVSSEPYAYEQDTGQPAQYFLIADMGYPSYGGLIAVADQTIADQPGAVRCLVEGSIRGWQDFLVDPAPAKAIIAARNPSQSEGQMDFAIAKMLEEHLLYETDPSDLGMMTAARWGEHAQMLKEQGLLAPDFDESTAYTLEFLPPASDLN
ncbi:MAG: ABC transporter substrate-binding protein [Qingshengfaniella sp.]